MREIRDKFSLEILDMTLDERKKHIKNQIEELKKKRGKVHKEK
ncbi:MAG: hypothetical protein WD048_13305 [Chitinophagales bacterium]